MNSILFTFDTGADRDKFIEYLNAFIKNSKSYPTTHKFLSEALARADLNPQVRSEKDKIVALFVSGKKLKEDTLPIIKQAFNSEIVAHSGSVEIREKVNDKWVTIQARRLARK